MDAAIIFAAAIAAACIIGAFIMMSRRDGETGEDSTDLVHLAEEKAKAEAELASTRVDLETTQQQLARRPPVRNPKRQTRNRPRERKSPSKTNRRGTPNNSSPPRSTPIRCPETHRRCLKARTLKLKNRRRTPSRARRTRKTLSRSFQHRFIAETLVKPTETLSSNAPQRNT